MLGLFITQSGPGVSPDSINYISVGENLYHGNGFRTSVGYDAPYTDAPPLYPILIAAFMHLGFGAEQAARLIPVLCFALLMFPLFLLGKTINNASTGYVACLTCLVFSPILRVTSYAWTEMPYIFFSALAILLLVEFSQNSEAKSRILYLSGFFTALAILTRYIGVTLVLVGLIVIVVRNKSRIKMTVYQALLFGVISCLPIIPWIYRNTLLTSNLGGYSTWEISGAGRQILSNVNSSEIIIVHDFFAALLSRKLLVSSNLSTYIMAAAIIIIGSTLFTIYVKNSPSHRKALLEYLKSNYVVVLYILIYLVSINVLKSILASSFSIDLRRICPTYPFLILVGASFVFYTYRQAGKPSLRPALIAAITVLCVLFLAFQAKNSWRLCHTAENGQGYNDPWWRSSQAVAWVAGNVPDTATVYSNNVYGIKLRIKNSVRWLPSPESEQEIREYFEKL
jgi:4-amino-4-deoxy-L-arabinose transferase-like glycosyltransferase